MLYGVDIELKDAIDLVLPARASCLEPCQYSRINRKLFIGSCNLFERGCWVSLIHAFSII